MNYTEIANMLFPDVTLTVEDIEKRYPKRELPEGAKVTRFAPSPTGFVHFGGLFPSTVCERLAHQSGGVFYLPFCFIAVAAGFVGLMLRIVKNVMQSAVEIREENELTI